VYSNIAVNDVLNGQVKIQNSQVLSESRPAVNDYGMYVANSRVTVSGTTFSRNGGATTDFALYTSGPNTAITLSHNVFYTNSGYPMRLGTDHLYQVQLVDNNFGDNYEDRVLLEGASLPLSATLTSQPGLEGYELDGDLTVPSSVTLDVAPGVVIMTPLLCELRVQGQLRALGTGAQPIIFTSENNSGASEWDGLIFDGGIGELDHVTVRYGGYNGYGLYAIGANAALSLSNSSLYTNSNYAMGVGAEHLHRVQMWNNTFDGNTRERVLIAGQSVVGDASLTPQSGLDGYEIEQDLTISTGVTLSVEPGVRVMVRQGWNELRVRGHLQAVGTEAQPIVFTSVTDSDSGQWAGLVFDQGTGDLRHVTVRYGGAPNGLLPGGNEEGSNILARNILTGVLSIESSRVLSVSHTTAEGTDYGLYVQDSRVVISGTTFRDNGNRSGDYAVYITGTHAAITVARSIVQNNDGDGTHLAGGAAATLGCSSFADNGGDGIHVSAGDISVMGAEIRDNTGFGLNNTSGVTVSALYNWWGSASGPTHPSNPGGTGDEVSDDVDYAHFLPAPQCVSDLAVTKLGRPDPVYVHDDLVYTITVNNNSALPVTGIVLTDNLPSHVNLGAVAASQGQCNGTDEVVTCDLGTLSGQARAGYKPIYVTLVVSASAAALQQIENEVYIASADYDPWTDNNVAYAYTTVQPQADLAIAKSSQPDIVRVGRPMTYTLVVTNNGPSIATGIRVTDTLSESMELLVIWSSADCDDTPGLITCDLYPMGSGSVVEIAIVARPTQVGTVVNTAHVSGDIHDRRADNNVATETVVVYSEDYCEAVSDVHLDRTPAGDLFAGDTVRFAARAQGSIPFTHTWMLDGGIVGGDESTFEHTFEASGIYTVSVTVDNACGQGHDTMIVEVQESVPGQPDLSGSYKSVNRFNVEGGDVLTYTLILRNGSATMATVVLTDPLPAHTTWLTGSAQASDGASVTLESGQLHWSGQVISGTPVVIQFAVVVTTSALEVGTSITNMAWLDDGLGNVARLEARSVYNPGYGLSINDGALYTNAPVVTLTLAWEDTHAPIEMRISNDGGFGTGSGWVPIASTYGGWTLNTYGLLTLPRTVYAKFRDGSGLQYGPVQDDIIYDPNPPQVTGVEIVLQPGSLRWPRQTSVTVRVTASDDNSGVNRVQLGHDADLSQASEYPVLGSSTDIPWELQSSGLVYVRAVDRAGNLSAIAEASGQYKLYLPIVLKTPQSGTLIWVDGR
jgi:uncharacterized repeat protein (TIGR01451 family)